MSLFDNPNSIKLLKKLCISQANDSSSSDDENDDNCESASGGVKQIGKKKTANLNQNLIYLV